MESNLHSGCFLASKVLCNCNSNTPAVDKIYFLVRCADEALLRSQKCLDDEGLFGPMKGVMVSDYDLKLDQVFGEPNPECKDEDLR